MNDLSAEFSLFLTNNPLSELVNDDDGSMEIRNPWGDKTLSIKVPEDRTEREALAGSLGRFTLPEDFSAVLHVSTGELEILWTAYRLKSHAIEARSREFEIVWKGRHRRCRFDSASPDLLTLAKYCYPISNASNTSHRNITSFNMHANGLEHPMLGEPVCFWVDCDGLDDASRLDFIRHLNSYMIYFDRKTPRILIHSPPEKNFELNQNLIYDSFPKTITARPIDQNIVSYWSEAFNTSDQVMKFLLLYRIIEYASFNFIDGETIREIRRELSNPALMNNVDSAARKMADAFNRSKEIDAIPRVQNMIAATVDMKRVWSCIEINIDYFKKDHQFDGGFTVKALLSGKCDFDTWNANAVRTTFDRLRSLRNALAHGQDGSTKGTVRPTRNNAAALVPWLNVLETIAADAMFLQEHV